ncbi:MAG: peptidylprolyl isomerase [Myxococcota bacterium]
MARSLAAVLAGMGLLTGLLACQAREDETPSEAAAPETAADEVAVLEIRDFGEIRIRFFADVAPRHVENFKKLAREGFYDGTTFHRVIPGFMIQGGDPNSKDDDPANDGFGGPGYTIPAEFNDIPHRRGIVSMARSRDPDSAGSQFFIMQQDSPNWVSVLDHRYTVFGEVVSGLDVVDAIAEVPRDPRDRPLSNVVIQAIRIES